MAAYLKKKKLYQILQSLVDIKLNLMKNATYKFYRGAEWLECISDETDYYKMYKLYHTGCFVSLNIYRWDEQKEEYVSVDKIAYRMIEGQLEKVYHRTEAHRKIAQMYVG